MKKRMHYDGTRTKFFRIPIKFAYIANLIDESRACGEKKVCWHNIFYTVIVSFVNCYINGHSKGIVKSIFAKNSYVASTNYFANNNKLIFIPPLKE